MCFYELFAEDGFSVGTGSSHSVQPVKRTALTLREFQSFYKTKEDDRQQRSAPSKKKKVQKPVQASFVLLNNRFRLHYSINDIKLDKIKITLIYRCGCCSPYCCSDITIQRTVIRAIIVKAKKKVLLFPETRPTLIFRPDPKVFIGLS